MVIVSKHIPFIPNCHQCFISCVDEGDAEGRRQRSSLEKDDNGDEKNEEDENQDRVSKESKVVFDKP